MAEVPLWRALVAWAEEQVFTKHVRGRCAHRLPRRIEHVRAPQPNVAAENVASLKRCVLDPLLPHVRFLSMTVEEFTKEARGRAARAPSPRG